TAQRPDRPHPMQRLPRLEKHAHMLRRARDPLPEGLRTRFEIGLGGRAGWLSLAKPQQPFGRFLTDPEIRRTRGGQFAHHADPSSFDLLSDALSWASAWVGLASPVT